MPVVVQFGAYNLMNNVLASCWTQQSNGVLVEVHHLSSHGTC